MSELNTFDNIFYKITYKLSFWLGIVSLAFTLVYAIVQQTVYSFVAVGIVVISFVCILLISSESSEKARGILILICGSSIALLIQLGKKFWPGWFNTKELHIASILFSTSCLSYFFWDAKKNDISDFVKNKIGQIMFASLILLSVFLIIFGNRIFEYPGILIGLGVIPELSHIAGKHWQLRLVIPSVSLIIMMVLFVLYPQWPIVFLSYARLFFAGLYKYYHSWMIWPAIFIGVNVLLSEIQKKKNWKSILGSVGHVMLFVLLFFIVIVAIVD